MAPSPGGIIAELRVDMGASTQDADITTLPKFIKLKKQILDLLDHQEVAR
jgi:hypothetical protein